MIVYFTHTTQKLVAWSGSRVRRVLSRPVQGSWHSYTQTGTCICTRTHKGTSHLCYRFPALACNSGQNARSADPDKLQDPRKCTPYYVTTRTSQFSSTKLPNTLSTFLSRIHGSSVSPGMRQLFKYKSRYLHLSLLEHNEPFCPLSPLRRFPKNKP